MQKTYPLPLASPCCLEPSPIASLEEIAIVAFDGPDDDGLAYGLTSRNCQELYDRPDHPDLVAALRHERAAVIAASIQAAVVALQERHRHEEDQLADAIAHFRALCFQED